MRRIHPLKKVHVDQAALVSRMVARKQRLDTAAISSEIEEKYLRNDHVDRWRCSRDCGGLPAATNKDFAIDRLMRLRMSRYKVEDEMERSYMPNLKQYITSKQKRQKEREERQGKTSTKTKMRARSESTKIES